MTTKTTGEVRELSLEEGWALIEQEAQRRCGLSATDFIEAWYAGKFGDDPDEQIDAFEVAMLLPFVGKDPWKR